MLAITHLRKSFGSLVAADDVSFGVQRVNCSDARSEWRRQDHDGLMIAGLVKPERGEVLVEGHTLKGYTDPVKRRTVWCRRIRALRFELSARRTCNSSARASLTGGPEQAIARSSARRFADLSRDPVKTFSGGMKRRLNLAAGLLHDPDVLLLDEPTVGVDPQSRNAIFDNLELLKSRGKALLYTTHYMEEVERLADRIVVMDHGRVIAEDTLAGLQSRAGAGGQTLVTVFLTLTGRSLRD
jgi:ABC-2 type transport system ATP-binding protein